MQAVASLVINLLFYKRNMMNLWSLLSCARAIQFSTGCYFVHPHMYKRRKRRHIYELMIFTGSVLQSGSLEPHPDLWWTDKTHAHSHWRRRWHSPAMQTWPDPQATTAPWAHAAENGTGPLADWQHQRKVWGDWVYGASWLWFIYKAHLKTTNKGWPKCCTDQEAQI